MKYEKDYAKDIQVKTERDNSKLRVRKMSENDPSTKYPEKFKSFLYSSRRPEKKLLKKDASSSSDSDLNTTDSFTSSLSDNLLKTDGILPEQQPGYSHYLEICTLKEQMKSLKSNHKKEINSMDKKLKQMENTIKKTNKKFEALEDLVYEYIRSNDTRLKNQKDEVDIVKDQISVIQDLRSRKRTASGEATVVQIKKKKPRSNFANN
eukprot:NODE_31_length_37178_cov_0.413576.p21 type:complete len:207 gc:universal NODE_31_length_37178_cov_0.413576:32096-32716(+)